MSTQKVADGPASRNGGLDRRSQILDEATKIIGLRGYYGFSIQEVATACGLSVAGVLHHFKTKERLLVALLQERDRVDEENVLGVDLTRRDIDKIKTIPLDEFLKYLRRFVVRNGGNPEILRLYAMLRSEALFILHPAHTYFYQRDSLAIEMLAMALDGRVDEPLHAARQFFAFWTGIEILWLRFPEKIDLVDEWDRAVDRFFR